MSPISTCAKMPAALTANTTPTKNGFKDHGCELVRLTDRDIIEFTRHKNSQAWKGALSAADYVLRETVLSKSQMISSHPGSLLVFLLRSKKDQTPFCSIELLVRAAWKYHLSKDEKTVQRKDILSGCIGGVYTHPEHRGNGYARIMVDELKKYVKQNNVLGKDGFLFLYSEIGEYYAKNGFKSFGVDLIKISLDNVTGCDEQTRNDTDLNSDITTTTTTTTTTAEFIKYHNFEALMGLYETKLDNEIRAQVMADGKARVTVVPSSNIIDWFHLRAKFVTYKLFPPIKSSLSLSESQLDFATESYDTIRSALEHTQPYTFGIQLKNTNNEIIGFAIWTIDWTNAESNKATLLKAVSFDNDPTIVEKLITSTLRHLKTNKIHGVATKDCTIWESEIAKEVKNYLVKTFDAQTGIENGSRSAGLMIDEEEDALLRLGDLLWEENTKLPWF